MALHHEGVGGWYSTVGNLQTLLLTRGYLIATFKVGEVNSRMVKRSLYIYGLLAFKSFFVKLSKKLITLGFKVLTKYCVKQNLSTM